VTIEVTRFIILNCRSYVIWIFVCCLAINHHVLPYVNKLALWIADDVTKKYELVPYICVYRFPGVVDRWFLPSSGATTTSS